MAGPGDTIAAIATSSGRSGVGIVRISGPESLAIARQITAIDPVPRYAHYCTFKDTGGRIIDRGILLYFQAPHSFTGEDVVELHGHGGHVVPGLLLHEALNYGARLARAGEFTERAFLNDKIDLLQAEAVADLVDSVSARAARSAARSLEGEFSNRIQTLVRELVDIRVYVEGSLDFPDEETDFPEQRALQERLQGLLSALDTLMSQARKGRVLREGIRIVIAGRTNVGKSSLMNRLAGKDRSIVTDIAGTTRDVIEDQIQIDGVCISIVDTAGLRMPENPVEEEGIRRSVDELEKADVIMLVTDRMEPQNGLPVFPGKIDVSAYKLVYVHNKIDLYGRPASVDLIDQIPHVYVSAMTEDGLDLLTGTLKQAAGIIDGEEGLLLARERHIRALENTRSFVVEGLAIYTSAGSAELLAEELRNAQMSLCEITGEFHSDDLIGEIFSRFCIGK